LAGAFKRDLAMLHGFSPGGVGVVREKGLRAGACDTPVEAARGRTRIEAQIQAERGTN
jgi:hypothetical protein